MICKTANYGTNHVATADSRSIHRLNGRNVAAGLRFSEGAPERCGR